MLWLEFAYKPVFYVMDGYRVCQHFFLKFSFNFRDLASFISWASSISSLYVNVHITSFLIASENIISVRRIFRYPENFYIHFKLPNWCSGFSRFDFLFRQFILCIKLSMFSVDIGCLLCVE